MLGFDFHSRIFNSLVFLRAADWTTNAITFKSFHCTLQYNKILKNQFAKPSWHKILFLTAIKVIVKTTM